MDVIIRIIQVILALSILVVIHEFGHFVFARLFKIRVEKFYLFFPPAIFKYKPKNSDTEWGIGSIPLGGFCKISGMIDESMDKETMAQEPQPWEYRTKPAWQRLLVISGGVLFNFIFAMILYSAILYTWGEEYLKNDDARYGIQTNSLSAEMGFRDGDRILAFDDVAPDNFAELQIDLVRSQAKTATVLRHGDTIVLELDQDYIPAILNTPGMFMLATPVAVAQVPDTSINASAGLMTGDRFVKVADTDIHSFSGLQSALAKHKGEITPIEFKRGEELITQHLQVDENGKIEVILQNDISDFHITQKEYTIFSAIPAGVAKAFSTIGDYIKELGLIFSPKTEAYKSVGSFIAIGSIFPTAWNWEAFWNIVALLSVMLAVINLLPIPALDGGHIVFTLYEMITGRKPSDKFMEYAQMAGMIFLLLIMFLAFGNDILRLFR
ncbi:MAG: RIP metalloprotease RseP [Bacteroidales bacterium]|nr:RIP metalloprotease RseP [Bacteroidales bacterium]